MTISEFKIESNSRISSLYGLETYRNKNLVLLSTNEMVVNLKRQNPQINSIEIVKVYPKTIFIRLRLYEVKAVIENKGDFLFVSGDGRILSKSSRNNLPVPVIRYYQTLNQYLFVIGDWITFKDIQYALHFIETLTDLGMTVNRVDINGTDMILCKIDNRQVIFTTAKSDELQDYELEQIIRQYKIEGRDFKSLDLRFEKPVVKF